MVKILDLGGETEIISIAQNMVYAPECPCCSKVHYVLLVDTKRLEMMRKVFKPGISSSTLKQWISKLPE